MMVHKGRAAGSMGPADVDDRVSSDRLLATWSAVDVSPITDPADPFSSNKKTVATMNTAHIRSVPRHPSRPLDVTVDKVETVGRKPRRFAFAPKDVDRPRDIVRAAFGARGSHPAKKVTVISNGKAVLSNLSCATTSRPTGLPPEVADSLQQPRAL